MPDQNTRRPFGVSETVRNIPSAMSVEINDLVYRMKRQGADVTTLSLGEAFFDQPMKPVSEDAFLQGMHYSDSQGIPLLRQKIANHYQTHFGADIDPETEIIVSAGSKPILFMSMLTALDPGDEVLILEPGWLSYPEQARLAGATARHVPYDADMEAILESIGPRTRMLIANNPNNPAGRLYTRDEIQQLYDGCHARGVYLLVDESYSDFPVGDPFPSLAAIAPDREGALVVNSLSKNLGVSGWRIGYLIGSRDFVAQLLKVNQHLITCAPTLLAQYCADNFEEMVAVTSPQIEALGQKRDRVTAMIETAGLEAMAGTTTFYFFISIGDFPGTDIEFAHKLLIDDQIAVVPGSAYGKSTDRFVRISIGTESENRIGDALGAMHRQIANTGYDKEHYKKAVAELTGNSPA